MSIAAFTTRKTGSSQDSPAYPFLKRATDIVGSVVLLALASPVVFVTLLVLTITSKGRPFFVQRRVGLGGRLFPMFKFRTMRLDAEQTQHQVKNELGNDPIFKNRQDPRITRFGRFLRRSSIDELPQLINVLLGHMSLVGPRPHPTKEVARYQAWHRRRLAVKPGLTCLWQIRGRSDIGFDEGVRLDVRYIKQQSLLTDLKLLVQTPFAVLSCKGAY